MNTTEKLNMFGEASAKLQDLMNMAVKNIYTVEKSDYTDNMTRLLMVASDFNYNIQCMKNLEYEQDIIDPAFTYSYDLFGKPIMRGDTVLLLYSPFDDKRLVFGKVTENDEFFNKDKNKNIHCTSVNVSTFDGEVSDNTLQFSYFSKSTEICHRKDLIVYNRHRYNLSR